MNEGRHREPKEKSMRIMVMLVLLIAGSAASAGICSAVGGTHVRSVTAITEVFGDGQKLIAAAVEFEKNLDNAKLSKTTFAVEGRTVTKVYSNDVPATCLQGKNGRYVIMELSANDTGAALFVQRGWSVTRKEARLRLCQSGDVCATDGTNYPASAETLTSTNVVNLVVDDFVQREYKDARTGETLTYNLFVPRNYDATKTYPLVLFMHDAGVTSSETKRTLIQGLGAIVWATPQDQAKHECFVLAPQYSTQIVNDNSEASEYLDITVELIDSLARQYSVDRNRIYTTGQSGGCMMSIAMDIKYPELFAASFLVAGQWDPAKVAPLAKDKLWIVVSEGDLKAFPGMNAITAALEKEGARVSRAVWDGRSSPAEFASEVGKMMAEGNDIKYVVLKKGTVVPPGMRDDGGSNHVCTWRIAYTIEGIREWLFNQKKGN